MATSSTPTRLRSVQVVLVVACLGLGLVLAVSASSRRSHVDSARRASELVVATQELRAALGAADAASVNAFLAGGVDQPEQRARYAAAIDDASAALQRAALAAEGADAAAAVAELGRLLPTYTGLVETARADNRQQLPLGAAYLRSASELLRVDVAAQLETLATAGADSFRAVDDDLTAGIGTATLIAIALVVALFVGSHLWLAGRTRRLLNPGIVVASILLVVGLGWVANALSGSASSAVGAIGSGYDDLAALSAIRADAYDQQAFSTFALVDRGARDAFNAKAATAANNVEARIGASAHARDLGEAWTPYRTRSDRIAATDVGGDYAAARDQVTAPISNPTSVAGTFARFDEALVTHVTLARAVLTDGLDQTRVPVDRVRIIGLVIGLLAAAAVAWGIQQRINDYR